MILLVGSWGCFAPNTGVTDSDVEDSGDRPGTTSSAETTTGPLDSTGEVATTTVAGSTADEDTSTNTGSRNTGNDTSTTDRITDTSGPPGTESTGSEATDGTSAGMACAQVCAPEAPAGWNGPYARAAVPGTENDSGCGGGYPNSVVDGFGSVTGSAATCDCSCGSPSGGSCEDPIEIRIYDGSNQGFCTTLTDTITTDDTPPAYVDANGAGGLYVRVDVPDVVVAPSCTPSASEDVPPAEYGGPVELCEGTFDSGECASGEVCVPDLSAAFTSGHCIFRDGESPCPAGSAYSERIVNYAETNDSRGCSACSCGTPTAGCTGSVDFSLAYSGGVETVTVPATSGCTPVIPDETPASSVGYGMDYDPSTPNANACSPSGGAAVGGIAPADAFTVCCTP